MNVPLSAPGYSTVNKRARMVKVSYRQPSTGKVTNLVIDSTGLREFGEGKWKLLIMLYPTQPKLTFVMQSEAGTSTCYNHTFIKA